LFTKLHLELAWI